MKRLLLTAALIAGSTVFPAVPAQASACSGTTGVTVIVDFGYFGGGVRTECASGDPSNGLAALHQAGFSTAGTGTDGPAFVCRINNLPGPAAESCSQTPPGDKSWSYFHATRGGSWVYSNSGALYRKPPQGSVEGWAFGAGARPSVPPPAAPPPPPPPPAQPTPGRTTKAASDPGQTPVDPEPSEVSPEPSTVDAAPSSVPVSGPPSSPAVAEVVLPHNSFTGTAIAIVLVLVLGAAAVIVNKRRNRLDT